MLLLCFTLLYSTLLYSTLLYSTLLYSTLLYSTLFYSAIAAVAGAANTATNTNTAALDILLLPAAGFASTGTPEPSSMQFMSE
ncbi:hypothetical protein HZH68_014591 [Vespula germanica]|uniref:Uncharacterized protein n=1 Tax=Vespula germanica TaxID=30212 RepID=A0A834JB90_VESGE|nr:hypothetical protein HZH68_014591 [Vespula germanica]